MKIAVASPVDLRSLGSHLFDPDRDAARFLKGLGGTQVPQLIKRLVDTGHQVVVVSLDPELRSNEERVFHGPGLTIRVGPFRRGKTITLDFMWKERAYLIRTLREESVDIVHAHWSYEFAIGAIRSGKPYLITVRDWAPRVLLLMRKPYRLMRMILSFFVLAVGRNLVSNSPYIRKRLRLLRTFQTAIIPNAIEDSSIVKRPTLRDSDSRIIVSINHGFGRLKNTIALMIAVSQLRCDYPRIVLRLIGNDYEPNGPASRWAQSAGLVDGVQFVGPVSHATIPEELDHADILAHPSLEESFGNTLVEAMARGIPIVAGTKSGAVPWVVGDAGVLVDVSDPGKIADGIRTLLVDSKRRYDCGARGIDRVRRDFSLSSTVAAYVEEYRRCIKGFYR